MRSAFDILMEVRTGKRTTKTENRGWQFSHFFWVNNHHERYDLERDAADIVQPEMMRSVGTDKYQAYRDVKVP